MSHDIEISIILNNVGLKGAALEWVSKAIIDKIESTSTPTGTLANLLLGIAPQRGSKGNRKSQIDIEYTILLKSLIKKYNLGKINLRESGGADSALKLLSQKMGRNRDLIHSDLLAKAQHIAEIKASSIDDDEAE